MQAYWWECETCGKKGEFPDITGDSSIVAFIRDKLVPSAWNQDLLRLKCKNCTDGTLRITYEFPREEKVVLRVVHIVGIDYDDYLPMMWETFPVGSPQELQFDFKYIRGRNPWGLNKAAVFSQKDLHDLFVTYRIQTGAEEFP